MLPYHCPCCSGQPFYYSPDPLFLLLCFPYNQEIYTWVGLHGHPFLLHRFQNFTCLQYDWRNLKIKIKCPYTWPESFFSPGAVDRTGVLSIYFIESIWFGWKCNFYNTISALECEHIIHIHIFLRMHIITSLCECVRICWMWTHHTYSYFSAHAYYYVLAWMCTNMLNVNHFIGMCNDVTSRSINQSKKLPFNTFKGIEHLWSLYSSHFHLCLC